MTDLTWSWLALPYATCTIALLVVAVVGAIAQGDRVLRLGVVGAATTTLPWALGSALVACTDDPETATRLLRLGNGPVSLVGPNLLLVVLGVSGQLERHRWVARAAAVVGVALLAVCWATTWTVPGVHRLSSGVYYLSPGPLTDLHFAQLAIWLAIGLFIVRRSSTRGERRRLVRILIMVLGLGSIGSVDVLMLHGIWGAYPIAWLPATVAAGIAYYLVRHTDFLRQRGIDRAAALEGAAFAAAVVSIGALSYLLAGADRATYLLAASVVWVAMLGVSWTLAARRPPRIASDRVLERFVAELADLDDHAEIAARLTTLWGSIAIEVRHAWRVRGDLLVEVMTGEEWAVPPPVISWLAEHGQAVAPGDLATMRIGAVRPELEAMLAARAVTLVVPLVDRNTLVGLVEADHADALREDERGLVAESARAAARAVTYAELAGAAAMEGENAREVEVAEAMRLQASASRDDELGRWSVAAEYRSAPRTTGAAWSTTLLPDGRLAVMVTEAQAHGVAAALATSALTGAFAAATSTTKPVELEELLVSLRASADGVMRGGEPIAAFLAVLDADRQHVRWACAGHPGAHVVGPIADLSSYPQGSGTGPRPVATALGGGGSTPGASLVQATRGETRLPPDSLLVITSSAVRGDDEQRWQTMLREQAPAGPRLASVLVEAALRRGEPSEDILAVVVRQRPDRHSAPVISR